MYDKIPLCKLFIFTVLCEFTSDAASANVIHRRIQLPAANIELITFF